MSRFTFACAGTVVFALLGLAACEGTIGGSIPKGRSRTTRPTDATPETPVGETPEPEDVRARCETSSLSPPALRRLTRTEYRNTLRDTFPEPLQTWTETKLGPDPLSPLKFTNDANVLLVGTQTAKEILKTAKEVADLIVAPGALPSRPCVADSGADRNCATDFVNYYAPLLYRRHITDEERAELLDYYDSVAGRSDSKTGMKWMIVALLQSPQVLYRSEIGRDGQLDPFEIATELSYTFGGTTPSGDLLNKAAGGQLNSPEALIQEARALQQTENGKVALRQFFREWAGYEKVLGARRDSVPEFAGLTQAMVDATQRFIEDVVLNTNGNVKELLTAPVTFGDAGLDNFYRLTAEGADATPIKRRGILAQPAFLAGTSHPTHTSPVFRGLMTYQRLLCYSTEPPPGNIPTIDMAPEANTTREKFEEGHAIPGCVECHKGFEPMGYAMEHFDEAGRYREKENNYEINTVAKAIFSDGKELELTNFDDLVDKLANDPAVTDCVSGLLATYAFAGGGGRTCLAEEQRTALAQGKNGLRDYFIQLASAPTFTRRQK